jgi:hypothetical protein
MGPSIQRTGGTKARLLTPEIQNLPASYPEVEPAESDIIFVKEVKKVPSIQFMGGGGVPKRDRTGGKTTPIIIDERVEKDPPIIVDGRGGENAPIVIDDEEETVCVFLHSGHRIRVEADRTFKIY